MDISRNTVKVSGHEDTVADLPSPLVYALVTSFTECGSHDQPLMFAKLNNDRSAIIVYIDKKEQDERFEEDEFRFFIHNGELSKNYTPDGSADDYGHISSDTTPIFCGDTENVDGFIDELKRLSPEFKVAFEEYYNEDNYKDDKNDPYDIHAHHSDIEDLPDTFIRALRTAFYDTSYGNDSCSSFAMLAPVHDRIYSLAIFAKEPELREGGNTNRFSLEVQWLQSEYDHENRANDYDFINYRDHSTIEVLIDTVNLADLIDKLADISPIFRDTYQRLTE